MIPVILESPYAGNVALHLRYLRACMRDSLLRGEAPTASHHLYTAPGVLRDEVPEERELGIATGFVWRDIAKLTVIYEDLGWSRGMYRALNDCQVRDLPWEVRRLGDGWLDALLKREAAGDALEHWHTSTRAPA